MKKRRLFHTLHIDNKQKVIVRKSINNLNNQISKTGLCFSRCYHVNGNRKNAFMVKPCTRPAHCACLLQTFV